MQSDFRRPAMRSKHRAYANLMLHRTDEASRDFVGSMRLAFGSSSAPWRPEFINTTPAKLSHDIEQYEYLHRLTGNPAFQNLSHSHRQFLDGCRRTFHATRSLP